MKHECEGGCGREGKRFAGGYWCCIQCARWKRKQHTVFCDKRQSKEG